MQLIVFLPWLKLPFNDGVEVLENWESEIEEIILTFTTMHVYRCLRHDEDESEGFFPIDYENIHDDDETDFESHILGGNDSVLISTTKSKAIAEYFAYRAIIKNKYATPRVAVIDLHLNASDEYKDPENVTEHVFDGTNATVRSSKMGLEVSSRADHFVRVYEEVLVSRRRIHPFEIKYVYEVADYIRELPFGLWKLADFLEARENALN